MATNDDTLLRERVRPKSTLLDFGKPAVTRGPDAAAEAPPDILAIDDLAPLPQPGDAYKAYARPDNKSLLMLRFLLRDAAVDGFAYSDLRHTRMQPGDDPGGGPVLVLRFVEAVVTEVRIEGRHLEVLSDLLAYHRVAWLREMPPGKMHHEKNAAVITRITIRVLEA
jgi:hypothetical protein